MGARRLREPRRHPGPALHRDLCRRPLDRERRPAPTDGGDRARLRGGVRARLPDGVLQPRHPSGARAVRQGARQVRDPLRLPRRRNRVPDETRQPLLLADAGLVHGRNGRQRGLRRRPARGREPGPGSRPGRAGAADRRGELDQHLRRRRGRGRVPAERAHRRRQPPRRDAAHAPARPDADLPPAGAGPPLADATRGPVAVPPRDRARDAVAKRLAGADRRALGAGRALSAAAPLARPADPAGGGARPARGDHRPSGRLLRRRPALALRDERRLELGPLRRLRLRPRRALPAPAVRFRPEQLLGLLRVRHRADELGPALVLRGAARGDGGRRHGAVRPLPLLDVPQAPVCSPARAGHLRPRATRSLRAYGRSRGV